MGSMQLNNKFAVIINNYEVLRWQKNALDELEKLGFTLSLIITPEVEQNARKLTFRQKIYLKFLTVLNKSKLSKVIDVSKIKGNFPELKCEIKRKGRYSEYFQPSDIENIKEYNLLFILKFGMGIIRGEINNSAELGIWSFHHGDPNYYKGGPPIFWEKYYKDRSIGVFLQRINNKLDAGSTLSLKTYSISKKSFTECYDLIYEKSIEQLIEVLKSDEIKPNSNKYDGKIYSFPKTVQVFYFIFFIYIPEMFLSKGNVQK